jgi:O-antigen ligase/polysaccharide polymerase Wzy-like membrane protein
MAAWIVGVLCALVIIKPQEFVAALAGLPLVYLAFAAVIAAIVTAVIRGRLRPSLAPQTPFVIAFFAWGLLVTAVKHPDALGDQALALAILLGLYLAVAIGCGSARGLWIFAATYVACAVLATSVAIAQGYGPWGCFLGAPEDWEGKGELAYDGRACVTNLDCRVDAPIPWGNYRCEHVGPLGTSSIGGRVRYRGSLADPNELSLMISLALPLAFALAATPKRRDPPPDPQSPARRLVLLPPLLGDRLIRRVLAGLRSLPALALSTAVGFAVVLSQSRSGMIAFVLVLGIAFIRRAGAVGVLVAALLAPPMLLLGGRSGEEAEQSSDERAELLREAFEFIRGTRGFGLGLGQFTDESSIGLTAHNAYVLAASEAGIIGLVLFGLALYLSLKVPVVIWRRRGHLAQGTARLAPALGVALAGVTIGIFFLSWTYKDILYLLIGASAALYAAARADDEELEVRLSVKEAIVVAAGLVVMLAGVWVGTRSHRG